MCKSRSAVLTSDPQPRRHSRSSAAFAAAAATTSSSFPPTTTTATSSSSAASLSSLSSLRSSLSDPAAIYPFAELRSATNNFLTKCRSSSPSSSSWSCNLRGRESVVFQFPFRREDPSALPLRLAALSRSHHSSIVRLLGASLAGDSLYIAYEHAAGSSLTDCLRNPRNPSFTPLSTWISRIQIAADIAQAIEYIHCQTGIIHNRLKSSGVVVADSGSRAKIYYFGAADLSGEVPDPKLKRSGSGRMRIEGTRGYMAPEVIAGGEISQASDVFALGVLLLELINGEEPVKYRLDADFGDYVRASLIESAREMMGMEDVKERRGKVRRWVDRRLRDSFPVEVVERMMEVALRCAKEEPLMRPDATWVAGKVSRLLLDSEAWWERVKAPTDLTVSLVPR